MKYKVGENPMPSVGTIGVHNMHKSRSSTTRLLYSVILLACALLTHFPSYAAPPEAYDPMQTALCLNYALVSLCKIASYNDVGVLDQEYNNIINNINLSKIEDYEVVDLFTDLMDTLTAAKITDKQKDFIRKRYERKVGNAMYAAFGNIRSGMHFTVEPTTLALNALQSIGMGYFNYKKELAKYREEREEEEWKIDEQILRDLNDIRKSLFEKSWELLKRYDFPDAWRLVEKQVEEYVNALKDNDAQRRLRKLNRMKQQFQAYPPFWYYLGITAQELRLEEDALVYYDRFDTTHKGIFRKDPFVASVSMNRVALWGDGASPGQITASLETIVDNSENSDWNNFLFVALHFARLGDYQKADELLIRNIDYQHEVSLHNRIRGELMLEDRRVKDFDALINKMLSDDSVRHQDILYLFGKSRNKDILKKLEGQILKIVLYINSHIFTDDDVILKMPVRWHFDNMEISLNLAGKTSNTSQVNYDLDTSSVIYTFSDLFNSGQYMDQGEDQEIRVSLVHDSYPIDLIFLARIISETKQRGRIGKWLRKEDTYVERRISFEMMKVMIGGEEYLVSGSSISSEQK